METITPGKYIEITYDLYRINPDGTETLVHQIDPAYPEPLVFGVTRGVVIPLEKALQGLKVGDAFDVKATADEAFGHYEKENVVELDKEVFEVDGKFDDKTIKVGARLPMMTADGFKIEGEVIEITPKSVKMDFNHPLADRDVRFKGKVITVRDATEEEIHPAGGCGCHHGGCGCEHDSCGCSDGDGCGCDCGDDCECGPDCDCNDDHNCGDPKCKPGK